MKSIPSYFGGLKMSEEASCEQLTTFLKEFSPLQRYENPLTIGNVANCTQLPTSFIFFPP
jgi:hypothetical protein